MLTARRALLGLGLLLLPALGRSTAWQEDWRGPADFAALGQHWAAVERPAMAFDSRSGERALVLRGQFRGVSALDQRRLGRGRQALRARCATQAQRLEGLILILAGDRPGPGGLPYNGYGFCLDGAEARILRRDGGQTSVVAHAQFHLSAAPADFSVEASMDQGHLSLSMNGRTLVAGRDSRHRAGFAGLGALPTLSPVLVSGLEGEDEGLPLAELQWPGGAEPVLRADQDWEHGAVFEPSLCAAEDGLLMAYTGGWGSAGIGLARSTDGKTWTKLGKGPVVGLGEGGEAGSAQRSHLLRVDGGYRLYYVNAKEELKLARSSNGLAFQADPEPLLRPGALPGVTGWASQGFLREGRRWWMLAEGHYNEGPTWRLHLFRSQDDGLHFEPEPSSLLTSLQVGEGVWCSPRALTKAAGAYHLWYHVSEAGPLLPTVLWHATSKDLRHWQPDLYPALSLPGQALGLRAPDQVADPDLLEWQGRALLFYDATDNTFEHAAIGLAEHPPGLADWLERQKRLSP